MRPKPAMPSVRPASSAPWNSIIIHSRKRPSRTYRSAGHDFSRNREQQREREIGRRVGQHAGRVRHHDAAARGGRDVDVVVTDGNVRNDFQPRAAREQRVVDAVGEQRNDRVGAACAYKQLRRGIARVGRVGVDGRVAGEQIERLRAGPPA